MPTKEERRDVAERFRDFETLRPIFKESNICAFLEALGVKGYWSWEEICGKLADLIEPEPERTCEIITDEINYAHCSLCGYQYDYHDCTGIGCAVPEDEYEYEYNGKYCKNCGAKVVNNA